MYWEESNPEDIVWVGVWKLIFSEWLNKGRRFFLGKSPKLWVGGGQES